MPLSSALTTQSFHCGSLITSFTSSQVCELCHAPLPSGYHLWHQPSILNKTEMSFFCDTTELNLYPADSLFSTPSCPSDDCFIGYVVLAPNQGLRAWLCAMLYVVSYFLAGRIMTVWLTFTSVSPETSDLRVRLRYRPVLSHRLILLTDTKLFTYICFSNLRNINSFLGMEITTSLSMLNTLKYLSQQPFSWYFCTHIHGPQRMKPTKYGDCLTIPPASPAGWRCSLLQCLDNYWMDCAEI